MYKSCQILLVSLFAMMLVKLFLRVVLTPKCQSQISFSARVMDVVKTSVATCVTAGIIKQNVNISGECILEIIFISN